MTRRILSIAVECLLDLGVMVLYASFAGLLIAAISVSDHGLAALLPALGYAALLPLAVLVLIVADAVLRALGERRETRKSDPRRKSGSSTDGFAGAAGPALR